jgi:1-acyl-sn-glycerol-3-phosphate acyltransferase
MPPWFDYLWYELTWYVSFAGFTLGNSLRVEGRENFPMQGPALVITNHQSYWDPLLNGLSTRRHQSFVARRTLFGNRFFAWLINRLNAVPIDQEGIAKEDIKAILKKLQEGRAVVIYPEGERTADGQLQTLMPGIVLLIKRVQAPIVPVAIAGAFDAWPRTQKLPSLSPLFLPANDATIAVSVGKPLDPGRYAHMPREQILKELFDELQKVERRAEKLRRKRPKKNPSPAAWRAGLG